MPDSKFYRPFEQPTKEEWNQILGKSAQKQLIISENIKAPVFIHPDDAPTHAPLAGKNDNQWNIVERISVSSAKKANQLALEALKGGASEILFLSRKLPDLDTLLDTIKLSMIHTSFEIQNAGATKMLQLMSALQTKVQNPTELQGAFQLNPFSKNNRLKPGLKNYLQKGDQLFPNFKLLCLRQNKDLAIEQALAQIIKQIEKLFRFTKNKALVVSKLQIQLSGSQNILKSIASIRAFKLLWFQLQKEHGLPLTSPDITVILDDSQWHEDPNQNRILATSQAMAAVIGGCNHLIIPPVDKKSQKDHFSARINRNIQHIMKMESNMDRVIDPAAGSKVIEALTDAIALGTGLYAIA